MISILPFPATLAVVVFVVQDDVFEFQQQSMKTVHLMSINSLRITIKVNDNDDLLPL